jgi:hypothetical protein
MIDKHTFKINDDGSTTVTGEGLKPIALDLGYEFKNKQPINETVMDDLGDYLITNRVLFDLIPRTQLNESDPQYLSLSEEFVEEAIQSRDALLKNYGEEGMDRMEDYAKRIYEYKNNIFDLQVDSGMLSEEDANIIKENNPNHIQFYRDFGEDGDEMYAGGSPTKGKFSGVGTSMYKFKGSDKPIQDVFQSLILDTYRTWDRSVRNKVASEVINLGQNVPGMVREITPGSTVVDGVEYTTKDLSKKELLETKEEATNTISENKKRLTAIRPEIINEERKLARSGS